MNNHNQQNEDAKLSALLHHSKATPVLPPRFKEDVWRRIADAERSEISEASFTLQNFIEWILRPRLAIAGLAAVILIGGICGMLEGSQLANREARARYVASVSPNFLR